MMLLGQSRFAIVPCDALKFLDHLPADSVDLCFFSPPYEAARTYSIGFNLRGQDWVDWMVKVFAACQRVCRGLVACVCEGQTRDFRWSATPVLLAADLHRAGMNLRKPAAFHRIGIPGSGGPDWLRNDFEFVICATRGGQLPWSDKTACGHPPKWVPGGAMANRLTNGERVNGRRVVRGSRNGDTHTCDSYKPPEKANPGNVIRCKVGGGLLGHALAHENEAPFPLALADFFVRSFCPPDGIVCDPFLGSGTTLHSALLWGRRFVGCDIRADQVDIARRRAASVTPMLLPS